MRNRLTYGMQYTKMIITLNSSSKITITDYYKKGNTKSSQKLNTFVYKKL